MSPQTKSKVVSVIRVVSAFILSSFAWSGFALFPATLGLNWFLGMLCMVVFFGGLISVLYLTEGMGNWDLAAAFGGFPIIFMVYLVWTFGADGFFIGFVGLIFVSAAALLFAALLRGFGIR